VRQGLRMVQGLSEDDGTRLAAVRPSGGYSGLDALWRRTGLPARTLRRLAAADAFRGLGLDRRAALWAIRGLAERPLDLFAATDAREGTLHPEVVEPPVALEPMKAGRAVAEDYCATGLSLRGHPLAFLRGDLDARGYRPCGVLATARSGRAVTLAGLVLMRQRPGSAKGTMFITLEDETGIANLIVWPRVYEANRRLILTAGLIGVRGRVQRQGLVVHVVAERLVDLSAWLRRVGEREDGKTVSGENRDDSVRKINLNQRSSEASPTRPLHPPIHDPSNSLSIKVPTRNFR